MPATVWRDWCLPEDGEKMIQFLLINLKSVKSQWIASSTHRLYTNGGYDVILAQKFIHEDLILFKNLYEFYRFFLCNFLDPTFPNIFQLYITYINSYRKHVIDKFGIKTNEKETTKVNNTSVVPTCASSNRFYLLLELLTIKLFIVCNCCIVIELTFLGINQKESNELLI